MGNQYYLLGRRTLNGNPVFYYVQSRTELSTLPNPRFLNLDYCRTAFKSQLVKAIERQDYVCTCIYNHGRWEIGNEVHVYHKTGLRTNPNSTILDNLDKLFDFDLDL